MSCVGGVPYTFLLILSPSPMAYKAAGAWRDMSWDIFVQWWESHDFFMTTSWSTHASHDDQNMKWEPPRTTQSGVQEPPLPDGKNLRRLHMEWCKYWRPWPRTGNPWLPMGSRGYYYGIPNICMGLREAQKFAVQIIAKGWISVHSILSSPFFFLSIPCRWGAMERANRRIHSLMLPM